ncbi:MAG: phosphatidate cytidylyltransferase [Phycisphaerales bacterium JB063]
MLKYRLTLGPILVALLLAVLWLDQFMQHAYAWRPGIVIFALIMLPAIRIASIELARMFDAKGHWVSANTMFLAGVAGCLGLIATGRGSSYDDPQTRFMLVATAGCAAVALAMLLHAREKRPTGAIPAASAAALAFVYLGLMPGFFLALRAEHSAWVLAIAILVVKACDIGAYATGMTIGKHKLIYWLSPGKTWEGLAGGVVLAMLVSVLLLRPLADLTPGYALLVGAVLGVVGQLGDLAISLLKRDAQVKDAGQTLPGFGGVLDMIDSPLLAAPVAYWLLA